MGGKMLAVKDAGIILVHRLMEHLSHTTIYLQLFSLSV